MECHNCKQPMTGRKRKFCTKRCGTRYAAANNPRTCGIEGCGRPHAAKGMCKTHYNATSPNRHPKVLKPCAACGREVLKEDRQRYARTYCSLECRDLGLRKNWPTCTIPENHWSRWYGKTSKWTPRKERATFFANQCNDCETNFVERAYGVPSDYCSETCSRRATKRRRRAREHNAPGDFTLGQVIRQYIRQGSVCAYCAQPVSGLPDPEHVTPLSRGGRNDMSNIVAACRSCNADKGDLTLDEWVMSRRERGLPMLDTSLTGTAFNHLWIVPASRPAWRDREADQSAA